MNIQELVAEVKRYAREHYEDGWDRIVETVDDAQLTQWLTEDKVTTVDEAIKNIADMLGIKNVAPLQEGKFRVRYDASDGHDSQDFNTLAEVQQFVKARWQGVEYMDGNSGFHTDYASYTLQGCTLNDLGQRSGDGWDWEWKDLSPKTRPADAPDWWQGDVKQSSLNTVITFRAQQLLNLEVAKLDKVKAAKQLKEDALQVVTAYKSKKAEAVKKYAVEILLVEFVEGSGQQLVVDHTFSPPTEDYDAALDKFHAANRAAGEDMSD